MKFMKSRRQTAIESMAHIGSWEISLNDMRIAGSPEFFEICGIVQKPGHVAFTDLRGIVDEEDMFGLMDVFSRVRKGEKTDEYELEIKRQRDGERRLIRVLARNKNENRPDGRIFGIVQDITDLRSATRALEESERSKAVLLSNLPGMAYRCLYDRDYTMTFVSEGCYALTGYLPSQLLNNRKVSYNDLICAEYRDDIWCKWEKAVTSKKGLKLEYPIITAKGDKKWVSEQGRGIYDGAGDVVAIEGFIQDITERMQMEEEARYLNYHDALTGLYNRAYLDEQRKLLDTAKNLPLTVMIGDINGLKLINDAFGHDEGDKLLIEIAHILRKCCRPQDIVARTGGDEFCILMPKTDIQTAQLIQKAITEVCADYGNEVGKQVYYASISLGNATKTFADESILVTMKLAEQYMYKRKLLEQKSILSSIMSSIKTTMFEKSHETEEHAERMAELSKKVGSVLNLTEEQLNDLELLSTLHDIGKISIDENILSKKGRLTNDEWYEIKRHPEIGYRIALSSAELKDIAEYILCHHEWWDGSGYPQGLKGGEIPLLSRIISIIDAYDAMTQDRPYRKAMSAEAALHEIGRNAGTQFDPKIAEVFIETMNAELEAGEDKQTG
jgi:diguanylate cyclase (GGDEF)-like protein/PAS domain S-box-containing protein